MKSCSNCNKKEYALGLCINCYQVSRYWAKKGLAKIIRHQRGMERRTRLLNRFSNVRGLKKAK